MDFINQIVCGDCLGVMPQLPDGCVDLIVADYPFAFSENVWDISFSSTVRLVEETLPEFQRLLCSSGAMYLMLGHDSVAHAKIVADGLGITLVNWIVWKFGVGYHPTTRFKTRAYHILYLAKGDTWTFNSEEIRIPHKTNDYRNNPLGAVPSDVWDDIPDVKKNSHEYKGHKGQKPEMLLERIIKASSNENNLVADFFIGSGTTVVVADRLNRRFFGIDKDPHWVEVSLNRLAEDRLKRSQVEMPL